MAKTREVRFLDVSVSANLSIVALIASVKSISKDLNIAVRSRKMILASVLLLIVIVLFFRAVFWDITNGLAGMVNIHLAQVVIRHPVEDIKYERFVGIDAALEDLHYVALAYINICPLRWAWAITFHLSDTHAQARDIVAIGIDTSERFGPHFGCPIKTAWFGRDIGRDRWHI